MGSKPIERVASYLTSHKKVFRMKTSACRDGTLKNQPNKMGTTPQQFTLVPFCQLCFVFVGCVHSRVVEGSWEGIAGCLVHVAVHGECNVVQCSCSRRDVLGWLLFMVGSCSWLRSIFQPNALLEQS